MLEIIVIVHAIIYTVEDLSVDVDGLMLFALQLEIVVVVILFALLLLVLLVLLVFLVLTWVALLLIALPLSSELI